MTRKILVVDDDEDMRRMLRHILEEDAEILEAPDGASALHVLVREKPALMLLDVTMPDADGLEVLERTRRAAPDVVVVMVTGQTDLSVALTALERGARAYITKPFDPQDIRAEVRRLSAGGPPEDSPPWRVKA